MAKYSKELVERIVAFIEADDYTVKELCEMVRISRQTFYEWLDIKPDFKRAVDDAVQQRDQMLVCLARTSLRKKIEGCIVEDQNITYETSPSNPGIQTEKSRVVNKKQCPPDLAAIKYVLEKEEKRKEKRDSMKPNPHIIYVEDQKTADLIIQLEKDMHGTEGELYKLGDPSQPEEGKGVMNYEL